MKTFLVLCCLAFAVAEFADSETKGSTPYVDIPLKAVKSSVNKVCNKVRAGQCIR